ncbi:MAG TPA: DNA adenine methylase [Leadbetterella sp.]|nr:DNA adenine methylase [Leadbetterella sp.]
MKGKLIAFNYFGGKYNWVEQLYENFPEHMHFVDVMCGSMSVTLNKMPSKMDTANDLDGSVYNFFKVLRDNPSELIRVLSLTPVSRLEYNNCWPIVEDEMHEVEWARRFFVRCRQSFQGSGIEKSTGFNACIATTESGMSKNVKKFMSSIEKLELVVERLKRIQIENLDYSDLIPKYDRPGTFFFVDPPYVLKTRKYKKRYTLEFDNQEHRQLAATLSGIEGKAMVCGNESELYEELFEGWRFKRLIPKGHSMKGAEQQKECIWMNF